MEEKIQEAKAKIRTSGWTNTDTGLWDTVFAFAHEFGWSAHYTINEVPILWIRRIMEQMKIYAEMQDQAAHGKKAIPRSELTPERKEEKDRKLAELHGLNYEEVKSNHIFG